MPCRRVLNEIYTQVHIVAADGIVRKCAMPSSVELLTSAAGMTRLEMILFIYIHMLVLCLSDVLEGQSHNFHN